MVAGTKVSGRHCLLSVVRWLDPAEAIDYIVPARPPGFSGPTDWKELVKETLGVDREGC